MGVPCPGCGRQYDVTLFEFGRTLWCTCGSRVALGPRARRLDPAARKRFLADAMLGRLARWLRLLGFDCAYESEISDEELVRWGVHDGRIILTRDRALPEEWQVSDIHLIQTEEVRSQLGEVLERHGLGPEVQLFSRCAECNEALEPAPRERVVGRVPEGVLADHERYAECPACRRVYWEGSHTERIRRVVDELLGGTAGRGGE